MGVKFKGKITGDCECFCWEVSEETYKEICGVEAWKQEKEFRESCQQDLRAIGQDPGEIDSIEWLIYPSDVLPKYYDEMEFTIEGVPS
jgi:hypothetical protein